LTVIISALTIGTTRRRLAYFTFLIGNYNNIMLYLKYHLCNFLLLFLMPFLSYACLTLLTAESLINAVYIRIASVARDTSANGDIVDNLTISIDAA